MINFITSPGMLILAAFVVVFVGIGLKTAPLMCNHCGNIFKNTPGACVCPHCGKPQN